MMEFLAKLVVGFEIEAFSLCLTYLQVLFATQCFLFRRKHRRFFFLRLLVSIILSLSLCLLFAKLNTMASESDYMLLVRVVFYLLINVLVFVSIIACYKESFAEMFLCLSCGVAAQVVVNKFYPLLQNFMGINDRVTVSFRGPEAKTETWEFLLMLLYHALMYVLLGFIFRTNEKIFVNKSTTKRIVTLGITSALNVNVLICIARVYESENMMLNIIIKLFSIFSGLLILMVCKGIFSSSVKEHDYYVLSQIWEEDRKQYEKYKMTMEHIDMKFHDLRKLLNTYADKFDGSALTEINKKIDFFDRNIDTGNKHVDLVLLEKMLLCEKFDIKLSYLIDGKCLNILSAVQIHSVISNILDNAIEAVVDLPKERRIISITANSNKDVIEISETNFFDNQKFADDTADTIKTTKENQTLHGYGIKSMKAITEMHNGSLKIEKNDNIFSIHIAIPRQSNAEQ